MPDRQVMFAKFGRPRYGAANPERVIVPLWEEIRRHEWNAYEVRKQFDEKVDWAAWEEHGYHSSQREAPTGPVWTWDRFGRTSTALSDGRIVHVAGEHDDYYDPDFCIYNDVTVDHPDGRVEFYLYPKDVFPPTDNHSATLVRDEIIIVGSLGYPDQRHPGETPVYALSTRTFAMRRLAIAGEGPGWICRHLAERIGPTSVLIMGGDVLPDRTEPLAPNTAIFELDLEALAWRRRPHGDVRLLPVTMEHFRKNRSPRYGTANPERADNPFWLEMVRRRWVPSRARAHFGDPPGERGSGTDERPPLPESVVWTAVRNERVTLTLVDGRTLSIGGEVHNYGNEAGDAWSYSDVIVAGAADAVAIYIYPREVFPPLMWLAAAACAEAVYIAGFAHYRLDPERSQALTLLRLDIADMSITRLDLPPQSIDLATAGMRIEDGRLLFDERSNEEEPGRVVALDLATLQWTDAGA